MMTSPDRSWKPHGSIKQITSQTFRRGEAAPENMAYIFFVLCFRADPEACVETKHHKTRSSPRTRSGPAT